MIVVRGNGHVDGAEVSDLNSRKMDIAIGGLGTSDGLSSADGLKGMGITGGKDAIVTSVGSICKRNTVEGTIPKEGIGVIKIGIETTSTGTGGGLVTADSMPSLREANNVRGKFVLRDAS
jgi:hypothetical protein